MIEHGTASRPIEIESELRWLAAYPPGMPAEIDVHGLGTLVDLFESSTAAFAERPAMLCFDAAPRSA